MSDSSDVESNERADLIFHDYSMSILSELNQKKMSSVLLSEEYYLVLTYLAFLFHGSPAAVIRCCLVEQMRTQ